MDYEESSRTFNLVVGLMLGLVSGVGFALLLSPRVSRTPRRARIVRQALRGRHSR